VASISEQVVRELDALIERGRKLDASFRSDGGGGILSPVPETEHRAFVTASLAAISRVAGRASEYYEAAPKPDLKTNISGAAWVKSPVIPATVGALVALRDAVAAGLLQSLESRLRASIHDDLLEQARDLNSAGYHVAAMVLVGGVLEDHLRKLCNKSELRWTGSGSLSKYNDLLREQVYPQTAWRRIQAIGDVRNHAAHGEGELVQPTDVADALSFTSRLLTDYPA
jgi:hypothetical protein